MADYPHLEITPEIRAALDAIPKGKKFSFQDFLYFGFVV